MRRMLASAFGFAGLLFMAAGFICFDVKYFLGGIPLLYAAYFLAEKDI